MASAAEWQAVQAAIASGRRIERHEFPTVFCSSSDDDDYEDLSPIVKDPSPSATATRTRHRRSPPRPPTGSARATSSTPPKPTSSTTPRMTSSVHTS